MQNDSACLYPSSLEVRLLNSILDKQPECESIKYRLKHQVRVWIYFSCPIAMKACLLSLPSKQLPCAEAHSAGPLLSHSQHTPIDHRWACSDGRSRTDFQVSSSHYLCSKLSSCIRINFLFPKVSSMYFKAAQLLFHIFQGTGVFNVM